MTEPQLHVVADANARVLPALYCKYDNLMLALFGVVRMS
jgi:hypothetical protein